MGKLDWPVYLKDKLILGDLDSGVGVATLWTPKENVADELNKKSYAVCGQLYTKRGLNPMFRNILANPKIRYLVMCGVDRQGSGDALKKFFENGVESEKVKGDEEALLDKEVPLEAYELLRKGVELVDMRGKTIGQVKKTVESL